MPRRPRHASSTPPRRRPWLLWTAAIVVAAAAVLVLTRTQQTPPMSTTVSSTSSIPPFTKEGELTFISKDDRYVVAIDVEIADNEDERMLGLMYRQELGPLQGMLFLFPYEEVQSFWMKNTLLSLDIMFINSRREIVTIHQHTAPRTEQSYSSFRPTQYVVEVNAGFAERHGIMPGDKVQWRRTGQK